MTYFMLVVDVDNVAVLFAVQAYPPFFCGSVYPSATAVRNVLRSSGDLCW